MATHGMIDLETLGVPDSVLMTIGAVKFNLAQLNFMLLYLCDIEEQSTILGSTIDDNTLAWWGKQPQEIQDEAFGEEHERVSMDP